MNSSLTLRQKCEPSPQNATIKEKNNHSVLKPTNQETVLDIATTSLNPDAFPHLDEVELNRPISSYLRFTADNDPYVPSEVSIAIMTAMFKTICGLHNLRRATGSGEAGAWYGQSGGELKRVVGHNGLMRYMVPDQSSYSVLPRSMKVMWDEE